MTPQLHQSSAKLKSTEDKIQKQNDFADVESYYDIQPLEEEKNPETQNLDLQDYSADFAMRTRS